MGILSSRLTTIAIAVIGIGACFWWYGHSRYEQGRAYEEGRQLKAMTKAMGDMRKRHEEELKARGWQDFGEAEVDREERKRLQARVEELLNLPPKTLIQTKVVRDESGCSCPAASLGEHFWMPYRAAGDRGKEADSATADAVPNQM